MAELQILMEMGFLRSRSEKALIITGNQGVEAAMEWLLAHSDDPNIDDPLPIAEPPQEVETPKTEPMEGEPTSMEEPEPKETPPDIEADSQEARSLRCDECGKLFKSADEVEFHAVKSGHQSFSESAEEVKALSEEEKKEQLRKLEEKIRFRRAQKEEEDRKEQILKEKMRRRTGQELVEAKKRLEEEEIRRLSEQRKKEKMEEKRARQNILEQIERDKLARKEKFGSTASSSTNTVAPSMPSPSTTTMAAESSAAKKDYDQSMIQIRLTNGQALTQKFGSKEELAAVRLYVEMHRTDGASPFKLMTSFPKRIFTEEDMEKPLYELGLVPSAVLMVTKSHP